LNDPKFAKLKKDFEESRKSYEEDAKNNDSSNVGDVEEKVKSA
jgi:hypothetical protein